MAMNRGRVFKEGPTTEKLGIPQIGSIRTGMSTPGKNGGKTPHKLDHFVADGKYAALFAQAYPDKTNSIQILFPSDDPALVCCQEIEFRVQNALVGRSNGFEYELWSKAEKQYVDRQYSPSSEEDQAKLANWKKQWPGIVQKEVLVLKFILVKVRNILGYWKLTTSGSASSIPNIVSTFDKVKEMCELNNAPFTMLPFDLNLEQHKSQKPGVNSVYNVLSLAANASQLTIERTGNMIAEGRRISGMLLTDGSMAQLENKPPVETVDLEILETE